MTQALYENINYFYEAYFLFASNLNVVEESKDSNITNLLCRQDLRFLNYSRPQLIRIRFNRQDHPS